MKNTGITVRSLSAYTGAEISGIDLREPLEEKAYLEIRQAINDWGAVFFRDQVLTSKLDPERRLRPSHLLLAVFRDRPFLQVAPSGQCLKFLPLYRLTESARLSPYFSFLITP